MKKLAYYLPFIPLLGLPLPIVYFFFKDEKLFCFENDLDTIIYGIIQFFSCIVLYMNIYYT